MLYINYNPNKTLPETLYKKNSDFCTKTDVSFKKHVKTIGNVPRYAYKYFWLKRTSTGTGNFDFKCRFEKCETNLSLK
jgi:hypothetical protein